MKRIGLISDTHGYLDPTLKTHFEECDEIWHAGDIGTLDVIQTLRSWEKPLKLVFGNIDPREVCLETHEDLLWYCEDISVFMTHIAGYPGRYNPRALRLIDLHKPEVVICGHSHILKIIYDQQLQHLHINPGASGMQGLHHMRTAVRFTIDGKDIKDMQVIELGKRGSIQ
jgi:putative phosphoesterase